MASGAHAPSLKWWGLVPGVGIILQAVVGGITVLVDLHPLLVAPHLLLSTALVWYSVWLALAYRRAPRRQGASVIWHQRAIALNVAVILFLGALTTGAGPHSGDAEATDRLALDPELIARVHAASVWLFLGLFALLVWRIRRDHSVGDSDEVRKAWGCWPP
ncbi:hypothetical protein [Demequina litorisediminis]|uniref:Uncharacterized protein n=1 Tax=Demequina litorisediminis TaxID=1849022 RepID=A0ABQ6IHJ1_9MICO|nr:hypothetical protein [Demequina litorisediminis]GMA37358.1 hypothetical protein GCM10025876_35620 [Demequina litorisediminis]